MSDISELTETLAVAAHYRQRLKELMNNKVTGPDITIDLDDDTGFLVIEKENN